MTLRLTKRGRAVLLSIPAVFLVAGTPFLPRADTPHKTQEVSWAPSQQAQTFDWREIPPRASRSRLPSPKPVVGHAAPVATKTPNSSKPSTRISRHRLSSGSASTASRGSSAFPKILYAIRSCESGSQHDGSPSDVDYRSHNQQDSSASGAYQVLDGTWDHFHGYRRAYLAPSAVQDEWAVEAYRKAGTRPWSASRSCWSRLV